MKEKKYKVSLTGPQALLIMTMTSFVEETAPGSTFGRMKEIKDAIMPIGNKYLEDLQRETIKNAKHANT